MGPLQVLAVLVLAVVASADPDGYGAGGAAPVTVSPRPAPFTQRSPDDNIFSNSGVAGVSGGGGYFPANLAGSGGGRVITLGGSGGGRGGGRGDGRGGDRGSFRGPSASSAGGGEGMPYDFGWTVQEPGSGNDFTHAETSDGVLTSGQYRVNLPDGRVQLVTYTVRGDSGYQAEVTYEGEAQYPPSPSGQRYSGPSASQGYSGGNNQRHNGGNSQSYSSPSSSQGYSGGSSQRSSSPSSSQGYSGGSSQSYSSPSSSQGYSGGNGLTLPGGAAGRAGRRYNGAGVSQRSNAAPVSTQYNAGPVSQRYNAVPAVQPSGGGFGSRIAPLSGGSQGVSYRESQGVAGSQGVSYRESGLVSSSAEVGDSYGAPPAPSHSYGAA